MRIAHISDLHFGTHVPEIVTGLARRLDELEPDLIIASGDFTMAGRHHEFEQAAGFLGRLRAPVLAVPGNHDVPVYNLGERFARPFARFRRYLSDITATHFVDGHACILGVNSARPWDLSFNWSHGHLSNRRVRITDRFFGRHPGAAFRALVIHHPFYVPEEFPGFRTIGNGDAMMRVLAQRGVQAVFAGHLHAQFVVSREIALGDGPRSVVVMQVASATSTRHRNQPNAFNLVEADGVGATVTGQTWEGTAFIDGEAKRIEWARAAGPAPAPSPDDPAAQTVAGSARAVNATAVSPEP